MVGAVLQGKALVEEVVVEGVAGVCGFPDRLDAGEGARHVCGVKLDGIGRIARVSLHVEQRLQGMLHGAEVVVPDYTYDFKLTAAYEYKFAGGFVWCGEAEHFAGFFIDEHGAVIAIPCGVEVAAG